MEMRHFWNALPWVVLGGVVIYMVNKPTPNPRQVMDIDSVKAEIEQRNETIQQLQDSIRNIERRDSIELQRAITEWRQEVARLARIDTFTDADIDAWISTRYGSDVRAYSCGEANDEGH